MKLNKKNKNLVKIKLNLLIEKQVINSIKVLMKYLIDCFIFSYKKKTKILNSKSNLVSYLCHGHTRITLRDRQGVN